MKIKKGIFLSTILVVIFFSCQKTNDSDLSISKNQLGVTIKDGMVRFPSIKAYLKVTEDKNHDQEKLFKQLNDCNFISLSQSSYRPSQAKITSQINSFTNSFDSSLYSEYLLQILNSDKMFMIGNFFIKVDMDNEFCSVLDGAEYPAEFSDILNNIFTNEHIMEFLNKDEPVLEFLQDLLDQTVTWPEYQDSLAKKGGQGICFKRGRASAHDEKKDTYTSSFGSQQVFWTTTDYFRGFLHFELTAQGDCSIPLDPTSIEGDYNWEGVCRNSGTGHYKHVSENISPGGQNGSTHYQNKFKAYSGGSALKTISLTCQTTCLADGTVGATASIQ